ncbi:MAG: GNAT family N-acetyltransferase [Acetobacteraceae bacterium]|nr:GNAT family N-acetyltransferase [Acetobacteraceae bacterium]
MTEPMLACITASAALETLRPRWDKLYQESGASPFQSPAWLLPWWHSFGNTRPLVACLYLGTRLAGLLPLYILDEGIERKILMIGVGISDHLDVLLVPDAPDDAASRLLQAALAAAGPKLGRCDLTDIPPQSALRRIKAVPGWHMDWHETDPCPVLGLPATGADLRQIVPARTLRRLRMNRHRADRLGGWRAEVADSGTLTGMLEALFTLHRLRWPHGGVFADPRAIAFYREAAPALLAAGSLHLAGLWLGERLSAVCMALLHGPDRILFYQSGYDPAYAATSPGSLLLGALIENAVEAKRRQANFLRGGEAYKYRWGAVDEYNMACRLTWLGG